MVSFLKYQGLGFTHTLRSGHGVLAWSLLKAPKVILMHSQASELLLQQSAYGGREKRYRHGRSDPGDRHSIRFSDEN